jgi:hypothetical protein
LSHVKAEATELESLNITYPLRVKQCDDKYHPNDNDCQAAKADLAARGNLSYYGRYDINGDHEYYESSEHESPQVPGRCVSRLQARFSCGVNVEAFFKKVWEITFSLGLHFRIYECFESVAFCYYLPRTALPFPANPNPVLRLAISDSQHVEALSRA